MNPHVFAGHEGADSTGQPREASFEELSLILAALSLFGISDASAAISRSA